MTYTSLRPVANPSPVVGGSQESQPSQPATGVCVTIHGHFYQPPRENPYLDAIERQSSAYPFHDWNERIDRECYRPNVFARILNDRGEVVGIVNNFEYMSFNIGPTLMSWLERYDRETYDGVVEADRKSAERLNGHGNAIAQVYNHIIMPLANKRDKYTQIRWGKADFRSHFGRDPEGMWLAEAAVDAATIAALIDEGIKFIILAPSQAARYRAIPSEGNSDPQWHEVGGGQIDPTRPYRCFLNDNRFIDIFFYDGPISRDMGFNDVLNSSEIFVGRLGLAVRGDRRAAQLISVATDGETFGHHKRGTEKSLAYAFTQEIPHRGWTVTNYAHYLSSNPPTWEVELKPVTAWSCSHGVDRWQDDCGCGGGGAWHQKWRKPLRESLNWLRDRVVEVYESSGRHYFSDPWRARDEYIQVIRDRRPETQINFLYRHQCRPLSQTEQIDALRLLEMQRNALFMFTSCGWFFEELSRPEGVQILRYAARAIELAGDIAGVQLEPEFRRRLQAAPSNIEGFGNGAIVYDRLVTTARVSFEQVAAHYAISALFESYQSKDRVYCYQTEQFDYQKQQMGPMTLAVGHLRLISEITRESAEFAFAVLHLGGWDFHCCLQPFGGRLAYNQIKDKLFEALDRASVTRMMVAMTQTFGDLAFNLDDLFAEERYRIIQQLTENTRAKLDRLYTQIYRDNYGVLRAFHRDELPVPPELQVAANLALSDRCLTMVRLLAASSDDPQQIEQYFGELEAIAVEANTMRCQLEIPEARVMLEQFIAAALKNLLDRSDPAELESESERIARAIAIGNSLHLGLLLERVQELYYRFFHSHILPYCLESETHSPASIPCRWKSEQVPILLSLGQSLGVDMSSWLN
ncbi:DUF3536 domain-containing protein [Oscillatoria sp. FACHB-1406]|uniref:DUF3536 domain-containing protein n=1 Tax=Oscillatoria sp. FACHB-1406 TaxID=2692846 RepID=UPI001681EF38|nr:DUF3536 domain-containing protein [Oscillatoria sp. FACHB-1406]MBD2576528.1 DUF3536 domain-containing protein [Oscillatoria sp. FACHB-1406]